MTRRAGPRMKWHFVGKVDQGDRALELHLGRLRVASMQRHDDGRWSGHLYLPRLTGDKPLFPYMPAASRKTVQNQIEVRTRYWLRQTGLGGIVTIMGDETVAPRAIGLKKKRGLHL